MGPALYILIGLAVGAVFGGVIGWLAAEVWVFSRLRIPVFDEMDDPSDRSL